MSPQIPVFDGHNDVLSKLLHQRDGAEHRFLTGAPGMQIDLPRAQAAGFAGGLCAIWVSTEDTTLDANGDLPPVPQASALEQTIAQAALLQRIVRRSDGAVALCRSAAEIRAAMAEGRFAAVFHIEGIEAATRDLDLLHVLHAAGLRTLGPVWSRPNQFAHGVPFVMNHGPDFGPGLSDAGRDLVRLCNELRIMIDLSHMNEAGFWDIAKLSDAPLVASHSNAFAICPHSRNATDRQLDAIRDTGGLIGLNFGVRFLHPEGIRDPDMGMEVMVRHIDYLVERVGIDHVALGSDFDGTFMSRQMQDVSGVQLLLEALRQAGYDEAELTKIAHGNWIATLERSWGG
ncbi:membrane dipeptidase [Pseudooceanicola sp. CBS1P-1]|uniref:Peptidase n=1 Tax=Pseudooceanicola albus TaxID=2692189 RepID=A0A6L7G840_9RHOB|nr:MULTISPECIES: dipeptidase [Pseudooceanicola]MBT9382835.1 membrane dipeptidase [Pseudooceanicola endophyticus]MXN20241.1 peptidase [Pseudooceanicola albus]